MKQYKTQKEYLAARALRQEEVDANYAIFAECHLPELLKKHRGEVALMKNGEILQIAPDIDAAIAEGEKLCKDGVFSAHRISDEVLAARRAAVAVGEVPPVDKGNKQTAEKFRRRTLQKKEVWANGRIFFAVHLPELLKKHRDKFALLKGGEVVGIFADREKAREEGFKLSKEHFFSVQKITDEVHDLGAFSRLR